jgi:hypothetical protein
MTRRIIGNLDFEHDLAEAGDLSAAAAARIAPLATLLRVFASDGDSVWTPGPVDLSIVPKVRGLPMPRFESGPLESLAPADETLAWGQSVACARLQANGACGADDSNGTFGRAPLHRRIWTLPRAAPKIAKDANDRRFFLKVATDFGCVLPGSGYFESIDSLNAHVVLQSAPRFVLKAPFSASGRARLVFDRDKLATAPTRDRVAALLTKFGGALLEPWMDRTDDFGALGMVSDRGVAFLGLHRQYVTPEGQFVGVTVRPFTIPTGITKDEVPELTVAARRAGEALLEFGYRGPFSVDSWRYRVADGSTRVQSIGEINARMTMGLVARVAAQRVFGEECVDEVTLRLDDTTSSEGPDAVVLLHRPRVVLSRVAIE